MRAPERNERLAAALLLLPALALSAEAEPLDEEFLEFLEEFGEEDDWAWFAQDDEDDDAVVKKTAAKPAPVENEKVKP